MADSGGSPLAAVDIVIIILYFVAVLGVGLWSSLRNRGSVGGYFLAGRSMHWVPVGASLFASNIGSGHFIGLAGSGAATGIGIAAFELNALFILLILGWVFVPVYIAAGVFTMPEYLKKRFGGQRIRIYLSVLALLLSVFTKVAADLFAGAIFINLALGWNLYLAVILLLAISALFTIAGGLTAVIWTDFVQTIIMIIGALILMVISFIEVGGFESLKYQFMRAVPNVTAANSSCGIPTPYAWNFFRPINDADYPWLGAVVGVTISSVWYWCSDQVIVQRALAAKNLTYAKAGTIFAGYLKILPMWLLVIPGMCARVLFTDKIACTDPDICEEFCGTRSGCTNIAYPTLVIELMPDGMRGLMLAVMMAALMSSLTSIFNSSSTIFTMDIWTRIRKEPTDTELMIVGRVFVLAMVGVSIAWLPIVQNFSQLFDYIQSVTSYLSPPICAIYVLAVLWKRTNEQGAFWGLMSGLVVGVTRFIWEFAYTTPACGQVDTRPAIITDVHYLHFGILLFGIVVIVTVSVSLMTKPIDEKHLPRLTFWSRHSLEPRIDISDDESDAKTEKEAYTNDAYDTVQDPTANTTDGPEVITVDSDERGEKIPCWKTAGMWICGIEKQDQPELTAEEKAAIEAKQTSLEEDPFWKKFTNINGLCLCVVAVFFWGFFY